MKGLEEEAVKTGPLEQVGLLSELDSQAGVISEIPLLGVLRSEGGAGESEPAADGRSQQEVYPPGGHGRAVKEGQLQDQRHEGPV